MIQSEIAADTNGHLAMVSRIATQRVSRYASISENRVRQAFLFTNDLFCGVCFSGGLFSAVWIAHDNRIDIHRDGKLIDQINLREPTEIRRQKAA